MSNRDEKSGTNTFRSLLSPTLGSSVQKESSFGISLESLLTPSEAARAEVLGPDPIVIPPAPPKAALPKPPVTKTTPVSPRLLGLIHALVEELDQQRTALLKLNPSRRQQLTDYLEKLAQVPSAQKTQLQDWIYGTAPGHAQAMSTYLEEVALINLAQAVVLKRWSEKGLRPFDMSHLGKLNWELSQSLKPYVPLHRESWHLTRPNLYSWFAPSASLQKEIFQIFQTLRFSDEGPTFIADLCRESRRFAPEWPELIGYDSRFYAQLSHALKALDERGGFCPIGRKKAYYSPTLRFGELAHHERQTVQWIGFEENPFALLVAELVELWWEPKAPPTWSQGNSLDAHPKEQLLLSSVAPGGRTGVLHSLTEMEACEMGFLLEERSQKASRLRGQLDSLPFFKKLRSAGTSLGTLQACVAITKIRPGGKLLWAREQPLSQDEGGEALGFLLGRAKLIAELNLTGIEHSLPTRAPLYPRYIYLLERETRSEARMAHRPKRIYARGAIRSHIEVPSLLEDVFQSLDGSKALPARMNWKFQVYESPVPQKDWTERWPDQASVESLQRLERLHQDAIPLAQLGTVRAVTVSDPREKSPFALESTLFIRAEEEPRRLRVSYGAGVSIDESRMFAIVLRDPSWAPVLASFLESGPIQAWIEHHVEKRSERWHLTEAVLKLLPVPSALLQALEKMPPSETLARANEIARTPAETAHAMSETGWTRFVLLARARGVLRAQRVKLQPLVQGEDAVAWNAFIRVFSRQDCSPLSQHPGVRVDGRIPSNSPIAKIDRLKGTHIGISFMTDRLEILKLHFDQRFLLQVVWDQVKDLQHPTWSEIVNWVQIPRSLDVAESAAQDLVATVRDLRAREKSLEEGLSFGALQNLGFTI